MFTRQILCRILSTKQHITREKKTFLQKRNMQISVIGATNDLGSNLALLLKQNDKIRKLILYDDDPKVEGVAMDLNNVPGGPQIEAYSADRINVAVHGSHLIVMVARVPRQLGSSRDTMLAANAPNVLKLCKAVASENPGAMFAIASNPLNSIVPFASALLYKYGCYNPFKVFGITEIDHSRARALLRGILSMDPQYFSVPIIGGHSNETIIPLFSNVKPASEVIDLHTAHTLTRLLRKAGTEVIFRKQEQESATLAVAMAVYEFVNQIIDALDGNKVTVNSYCANSYFGTRFFAGPTNVGPCGITKVCDNFPLNDFESHLLKLAIPVLCRDVELGEDHVRAIETSGIHL